MYVSCYLFGCFKLALIFHIWQIGTPICIPSQDFIDIGRIASVEINNKPVNRAMKGQEVAIKVCACSHSFIIHVVDV
jgi:translation initiation factor IF-2